MFHVKHFEIGDNMSKKDVNTNNASEVVKFDIVAMNGKERNLSFYDKSLITHTQNIQKYRDAGNMAILAIAHEMEAMDNDGSYAKGGFKSVSEYAQVVFDYKPSTVSLYVRSARAFMSDGNGETPFTMRGTLPSLTMGQMIELLPLVEADDISVVEQCFADGTINQRMSTKDIRHEVNGIRGIEAKHNDKSEKTATEISAKLGAYDKSKLPKGTSSRDYAITNLKSAIECIDNFAIALTDIEVNVSRETLNAKVNKLAELAQELLATVNSDK